MKVCNVSIFMGWLHDLKSKKLMEHQPKRRAGNAKWFVRQRIAEGRPLKIDS